MPPESRSNDQELRDPGAYRRNRPNLESQGEPEGAAEDRRQVVGGRFRDVLWKVPSVVREDQADNRPGRGSI